MADTSTILSLPYILPAQAQKHVTHNEAVRVLDVIVQLAVTARNLAAPPATPAQGDRYIVAPAATGAWAGKSGQIALYENGAWQFFVPNVGWSAYVTGEATLAGYNGTIWVAQGDAPLTVGTLGISATADATNRLSVSSPATLFNHAGAGHQLKLNKAAATDTASLLFQTGFSGRAEMGTAGSDDFSIKVSATGSAFFTGLSIAGASGQVSLPAALKLGGQASDPVSPPNGTVWLNTTTGEVKIRSNGVSVVIATASGASIGDGDKGDITVAGGVWSLDAGVVSNAKLANMTAATIKGRTNTGTGAPEDMTPAQVAALLPSVTSAAKGLAPASGGGTANFLRADGSWAVPAVPATTLTSLGIASTAADIDAAAADTNTVRPIAKGGTGASTAAGALAALGVTATAADIDAAVADTNTVRPIAKGGTGASTAAGALAALGVTATAADIDAAVADTNAVRPIATGGTGASTAAGALAALGVTATAAQVNAAALDGAKGDLTVSGSGTVWTIDPAAVGNAKLANMAATTFKGRSNTGTGAPEDLTAAQAAALLPSVTSAAKGLAPASGGGTANYLRADGSWAAPAGTATLSSLGVTATAAQVNTAAATVPQLSGRNRLNNAALNINAGALSGTVTLAAGLDAHTGWKAGAAGVTYTFAASGGVTTLTLTAGSLVQTVLGTSLRAGTYALSWTGTAQGKIGAGAFAASGVTGAVVGGADVAIEFGTGTLSAPQLEIGTLPTPFELRALQEDRNLTYVPYASAVIATTTGATFDLTAIPAWATEVTVWFEGVSTSAATAVSLQLGTAAGIAAAGYVSNMATFTAATTAQTAGAAAGPIAMGVAVAAEVLYGTCVIARVPNTNTWQTRFDGFGAARVITGRGRVALTAGLTTVRVMVATGTFDAGQIGFSYK